MYYLKIPENFYFVDFRRNIFLGLRKYSIQRITHTKKKRTITNSTQIKNI